MDNPYSSSPVPKDKPTSPAQEFESNQECDWPGKLLNESRDAIAAVSLLFSLIAMIATAVFGYYLFHYDPDEGTYAIFFDPYWMLMQAVRVVFFGWIALQLWRYQRAIKIGNVGDKRSSNEFAIAHNRFWNSTAWTFFVLAAFAILSIYLGKSE